MAWCRDLSTGGSRLRLLNDGVCPPEVNMPRDLALLETFERGEIPPTLRVYQWASSAITYGVNQELPTRLVEGCRQLGIPLFRRPTGGKAVLHGHDLTVALVFSPHPYAPLSSSAKGEGKSQHRTGMSQCVAETSQRVTGSSSSPALQEKGQGEVGVRIYPRHVYLQLAPALVGAFQLLGVPAKQGNATAPNPRSLDDGGDCFATPAIADIVHAETGVKLMGCALLVRGACVLMQASIPLRMPTVPVERLFGHPHPKPPPLHADALAVALHRNLQRWQ